MIQKQQQQQLTVTILSSSAWNVPVFSPLLQVCARIETKRDDKAKWRNLTMMNNGRTFVWYQTDFYWIKIQRTLKWHFEIVIVIEEKNYFLLRLNLMRQMLRQMKRETVNDETNAHHTTYTDFILCVAVVFSVFICQLCSVMPLGEFMVRKHLYAHRAELYTHAFTYTNECSVDTCN